jgi:hypothetical protein
MADVLDEDMPELSKEDPKKKPEDDLDAIEDETEVTVEAGASSMLWEDDDVKNFYENLCKLSRALFLAIFTDFRQNLAIFSASNIIKIFISTNGCYLRKMTSL